MTRPHRTRSGLTAIELVSALALFVIVLGALLITLDTATDIWSSSTSKNRAFLRARSALDQIACDLTSAFAVPLLLPDGTKPPASTSPSSAAKPLFMVQTKGAEQLGLYFIRQRSPAEMDGPDAHSLELVAYSFNWSTTNGLARYTRPVTPAQLGVWPKDLSAQLVEFKDDIANLAVQTNFFAPCVTDFRPFVYQPINPATTTTTDAQPSEPLAPADSIQLADLPDSVDILIGFIDRDAQDVGSVTTNYFTRRITLPAASASRLP